MLRVIFDTNTLISSIGWGGVPYLSLIKAIQSPDTKVFITQTIYDELEENFKKRKLEKYRPQYETFKTVLLDEFTILKKVKNRISDEDLLLGIKDREIYRTAVANNMDIIVTGDQPFLKSGIAGVQVMNPKSFIQRYFK